jgi:hypothetical protein
MTGAGKKKVEHECTLPDYENKIYPLNPQGLLHSDLLPFPRPCVGHTTTIKQSLDMYNQQLTCTDSAWVYRHSYVRHFVRRFCLTEPKKNRQVLFIMVPYKKPTSNSSLKVSVQHHIATYRDEDMDVKKGDGVVTVAHWGGPREASRMLAASSSKPA